MFFFLNLLKLLVLLSGRLALNARNRTKFKFRFYFSQFIVSIPFDFHFISFPIQCQCHYILNSWERNHERSRQIGKEKKKTCSVHNMCTVVKPQTRTHSNVYLFRVLLILTHTCTRSTHTNTRIAICAWSKRNQPTNTRVRTPTLWTLCTFVVYVYLSICLIVWLTDYLCMFARACVCDFSCSDQQFVRIRAALTLTYKQRVCENNFFRIRWVF